MRIELEYINTRMYVQPLSSKTVIILECYLGGKKLKLFKFQRALI